MKRVKKLARAACPALALVLALPVAAHATESAPEKREPMAVEAFSETTVMFDLTGPYHNVTVTVVGPKDFHAEAFAKEGVPPLDLRRYGDVVDGLYNYEVTGASTREAFEIKPKLDNGRGKAEQQKRFRSAGIAGSFRVEGGKILPPDDTKEEESKPDKPAEQTPQAQNGEKKQ